MGVVRESEYIGRIADTGPMSLRAGHRIRWLVVWLAVAVWFVGLAFDLGGNAIHLVLLVAMALLVYELLAQESPPA